MKDVFRRIFWELMDRVFPIVQPDTADERKADSERRASQQKEWEARAAALPAAEESLVRYYAACKTALDDERQRQSEITKMALLFVFDRVTGEPVYGMEEAMG
jgi:hypothetical protein